MDDDLDKAKENTKLIKSDLKTEKEIEEDEVLALWGEEAIKILQNKIEILLNSELEEEKRLEALNFVKIFSRKRKDFPYDSFCRLFELYFSPNFDPKTAISIIIEILEDNPRFGEDFFETKEIIQRFVNGFSKQCNDLNIALLKSLLKIQNLCDKFVMLGVATQLETFLANNKNFIEMKDVQKQSIEKHIITIMEIFKLIIKNMKKDLSVTPTITNDIAPFLENVYYENSPDLFFSAITFITNVFPKVDKQMKGDEYIGKAVGMLEIIGDQSPENQLIILRFYSVLASSSHVSLFVNSTIPNSLLENFASLECTNEVIECVCNIFTNVIVNKEDFFNFILESGIIDNFNDLLETGTVKERMTAGKFFAVLFRKPFFSKSSSLFEASEIIIRMGELLISCDRNQDFVFILEGIYSFIKVLKMSGSFEASGYLASQFFDSSYDDLFEDIDEFDPDSNEYQGLQSIKKEIDSIRE